MTRWWCHRRKHPWVLPRKVAKMVWVSVPFTFVEYDGCFLGASYYALAAAEGSTDNYSLMAENLHQIGYLSRKHPWVLPGCFLLWHHQRVIVYDQIWLHKDFDSNVLGIEHTQLYHASQTCQKQTGKERLLWQTKEKLLPHFGIVTVAHFLNFWLR